MRSGPGAPVRDCARAARERVGDGPAAPTMGSGRQAGTVPPLPCLPEAAVRALPAGATGCGALLRGGSRGTPCGSGGGGGLVKGPSSVVGVARAAIRAASQAPSAWCRYWQWRAAASSRTAARPAHRRGRVQSTLPWVRNAAPPPPPDPAGTLMGGGG